MVLSSVITVAEVCSHMIADGHRTFCDLLSSAIIWNPALRVVSTSSPSKLLLRSLATTDLFVGVATDPLVVVCWMSVVKQNWHFCRYAQSAVYLAGHVLCSVLLLTLTTIAVERLLALRLGLRYAQVVTLKRTCIILSIFWGVSVVASTMYFVEYLVTLRFGQIGALICLIISVLSNGKIFLTLRRNQHNRVQNHTHHGQLSQTHQFSAVKYRKAVNSAFWL